MTIGYVLKIAKYAHMFSIAIAGGLLLSLALPIPNACAQDITTGLVGHWTMDETSGNTISDSSGSGNDGTWIDGDDEDVSGETQTSHVGTALDFDGSDDHIIIPEDPSINVGDTLSLAFWVKNLPDTGWSRLLSKIDVDTNTGYDIQKWDDSSRISIRIDTTAALNQAPCTIDGVSDGTWHHVAYVLDNGAVSSYLDGSAVCTTGTYSPGAGLGNTLDLRINGSSYYGDITTPATMDDIRIYNRVLTAGDVAALYDLGSCFSPDGKAGEITFNDDDNVLQYCNGVQWVGIGPKITLDDGLVGHWTLDETSGNTITDSSGSGNDGTWTDGDDEDVTGETTTGKVDTSLTFDGVDDQVSVPNSASLNEGSAATVAFWVKGTFPGACDECYVFDKINTAPNIGFAIQQNSTTSAIEIRIDTDTGTNQVRANLPNVMDDTWHHVVYTLDNGSTRAYLDGLLEESATYSHGSGFGTTANISIPSAGQVNGIFDDIHFYNRAISLAEVKAIYAKGTSCHEPDTTGLIGHWTLNETSGNTIVDSTANNIDGSWIDNDDNDVTGETTTGAHNTSLDFDGTDDYVSIPDAAGDMDIPMPVTISAWIYPESFAHIGGIFTTDEDGSNYKGYWLISHSGSGRITAGYGDGGLIGSGSRRSGAGATSLTLNQWHHIVAVIRGSDDMNIYINGVDEGILTYDGTGVGVVFSGTGGHIGRHYNSVWRYYDGRIDDVRFYDQAFTPIEIESLYGATGGTCSIRVCSDPFGMDRTIVFNTDYNVMQYCNGGNWIAMGPSSDGGVSCAVPSGLAGELRYNDDLNVMQYCEGDEWITVIGR